MITTPESRIIDMASYKRLKLYQYFKNFEVPFTSFTLNVDITDFYAIIKKNNLRLFSSLCLAITKSANQVPEFRHRIVEDELIEFLYVYPSVSVLDNDNTLLFANGSFSDNFTLDYQALVSSIDRAKQGLDQNEGNESTHQIFVSNIPWMSFTSVTHPFYSKNQSIPIFTTGKIINCNDKKMIPISVQANHALIDGFHIGKFYEHLEDNLINFSV
jgi:chloramphenicol O-acetyltransferase type A